MQHTAATSTRSLSMGGGTPVQHANFRLTIFMLERHAHKSLAQHNLFKLNVCKVQTPKRCSDHDNHCAQGGRRHDSTTCTAHETMYHDNLCSSTSRPLFKMRRALWLCDAQEIRRQSAPKPSLDIGRTRAPNPLNCSTLQLHMLVHIVGSCGQPQ